MKYILLALALFGCSLAMREQRSGEDAQWHTEIVAVGVEGKLMCGQKPAVGVKVKLWEEDSGPDPDDLLEEGKTNQNGEFSLKGYERELTPIDPIFKVYHDCDDGMKPGQRKLKFRIPSSYVSQGQVPKRMFPIGILNLETIFPGEERDLL